MFMFLDKVFNKNKKIYNALSSIYGLNSRIAYKIVCDLGFSPNTRISDLTNDNIDNIKIYLKNKKIITEKDLKVKKKQIIQDFINLNNYKGFRYKHRLPSNGQRTHTNASTIKKLGVFN